MNTRTLLHRRSGGVVRGANTALSSPPYIYIGSVACIYTPRWCLYIESDPLSFHDIAHERKEPNEGERKKARDSNDNIYMYIYIEGERKAKTSKAPGVAQLLSTLHSALARRHHLTRPFAPLFHTKNARFNDSESEIIKTKTRSVMDLMNFTIWKSYKKMYTLIIYIQKNRVHETK